MVRGAAAGGGADGVCGVPGAGAGAGEKEITLFLDVENEDFTLPRSLTYEDLRAWMGGKIITGKQAWESAWLETRKTMAA